MQDCLGGCFHITMGCSLDPTCQGADMSYQAVRNRSRGTAEADALGPQPSSAWGSGHGPQEWDQHQRDPATPGTATLAAPQPRY